MDENEAVDTFGTNEDGPKDVAKRPGVQWPPEYWAVIKTTRSGALELSMLFVTRDEVVFGYMCLPLAGAKATVDVWANTSLAQGWTPEERSATRQLFLTIEGRGEPIVIAVRADNEPVARSAAAKINALAGPARSTGRASDHSIQDQLRMLATLRDHRLISDREFKAETADLLFGSGAPQTEGRSVA